MPENLMHSQAAGRAAAVEGMRGRTGNPVGRPREVAARPDVSYTPPATDAGGGFRYGVRFYAETAARRQQPVVDASTPTSLRWTVDNPEHGLTALQSRHVVRYRPSNDSEGGLSKPDGTSTVDPSELVHREVVRRPDTTLSLTGDDAEVHGDRIELEATKAGRDATLPEIIRLSQRHQALGMDTRTAVDHVMGSDHDGVSFEGAVRRGASRPLQIDGVFATERTRGNPVNPAKSAAKKVVVEEMSRIDKARAQAREYLAELAARERATLSIPEALDTEGIHELVDSAVEQAYTAATLRKLLAEKPQSERGISWFDAGSGDLAETIRNHHGVTPVTIKDGETAEFVSGEITSAEPEDAERAFLGLMKKLNPNGGVMLARVPLAARDRLLDSMTFPDTVPGADPAPDTKTQLDGTIQVIPDGSHAFFVIRTSVRQPIPQR